jgi:putative nucleotidyltransferase with HDIG domain
MIYVRHLSKRFLFSLTSRKANTQETIWIECVLTDFEARQWRRFNRSDQRHSLVVAKRFITLRPKATNEEIAAALLHDIGKVQSDLGTLGRVFATLFGPRTSRFAIYLDHESLGVRLLEQMGTNETTIGLLRGIGDSDAIRLLSMADDI